MNRSSALGNAMLRFALRSATLIFVFAYQLLAQVQHHDSSFVPIYHGAVPSLLIIGTAKGGTTDMFYQLVHQEVNNPAIRSDPPFTKLSLQKEVGLMLGSTCLVDFLLGRTRFLDFLRRLGHPCADSSLGELRDCIDAAGNKVLTMDGTPDYFSSPYVPVLLEVVSPYSKILLMLRDPVERTESRFYHYVVEQGEWPDRTLDQMTTAFLSYVESTPLIASALQRLEACTTAVCYAHGWRDAVTFGLLEENENFLFAAGMYSYMFGPWRISYMKPGRFMVVDSHAYYRDRVEVMGQVIKYLYGRPMNDAEVRVASKQKCSKRQSVLGHGCKDGSSSDSQRRRLQSNPQMTLSAQLRAQLYEFYDKHVFRSLPKILEDLRQEGAWTVGFDSKPWVKEADDALLG